MEEKPDQTIELPEQEQSSREHLINRRRLVKMLAIGGGAVAADLLLPETWSPPTVEAQGLEARKVKDPMIMGLRIRQCQAKFEYIDPLKQVYDNTTLMGVAIDNVGNLQFDNHPSDYDGSLSGNSCVGQIRFSLGSVLCGWNGSHRLYVQLRIYTTPINASDPIGAYRATNILSV